MTTDINFKNLEHRQFLPLPSDAELRVLERVLGHCLHRDWSREHDHGGWGSAVCDMCRASIEIGSNRRNDSEPDPLLSDSEISEKWLRELPRPGRVEIVANQVLRTIESEGWNCMVFLRGTEYSCSMSKGSERFLSGQQVTRSMAIVEAAAQIAAGKFPR